MPIENMSSSQKTEAAMTTHVRLTAVSCGTELQVVQEGIPDIIPVDSCYLGWQDSLDNLPRLVEPEINQ